MRYFFNTFLFISAFAHIKVLFAVESLSSDDLRNAITPGWAQGIITTAEGELAPLDSVLDFVRDSIFALLAVAAIAMFLFIWGRLLMARGNTEEFKKALNSFIYAAIGIFVVAAAWWIVRLIAGINL